MEGIKSKLVCVIGAPSSGKSTLAASVHHGLKISKRNSILVVFFRWDIPGVNQCHEQISEQ